jgi:hypothetical protein
MEEAEGGQKYTHVGTAYIKQSDVSTPIRKMSEGETIQVIPTSVEPGPDGKMSVEKLKEGFDKDNGECPMKTDVPPGILMTNVVKDGVVGSIAKGTPYQWVHPGGWVYKMGKDEMGKDDFYYTGLKAIGWKNTDKSLKDSISAINNISGGGRKRRRKTKRKRTKRRKTKRKRTKRGKTKRKKRRGRKKTRR